jgi:hypothetical protein
LDWSNLSLTVSKFAFLRVVAAMNCNTFFEASVLPAPDSPDGLSE